MATSASPRESHRDQGAATVWVLAVGLATVLLGSAASATAAAIVARHRAEGAADLGALAGAGRAIEGEAVACGRAAEIVTANEARLVDCRLDGLDLTVVAEVRPAGVAALGGVARASARAGPVHSVDTRRALVAAIRATVTPTSRTASGGKDTNLRTIKDDHVSKREPRTTST